VAKLPRSGQLAVERRKVVDYLLSETHPDGESKARFFTARGFTRNRSRGLADALLQHGREREVETETSNDYGIKYILRCELVTPDKRNPCIKSVWILENDDPPPARDSLSGF